MIKHTYLTICILLGACFTACQDYVDDPNPPVLDGNRIEVSIATNVPAITVQTRAEASNDEMRLQHVDVLVFKVEEDKELFAYRTTHTNDLSGLDYSSDIQITTQLKTSNGDEMYRIVFIANLKDAVDILTDSDVGIEKEDVLKKITFTQEGKWPAGENNFRALPMWGEAPDVAKIDKNTTAGSFGGSINLIRSVARIDLGVNITDNDNEEKFKIKKIKIYHARKEGLAVPFPDNFDVTAKEVTVPSLSTNSATISKDELTYEVAGNKLTGVYVNEALNKKEDETEADTPLFLILQASYNGGNDTYYKVSFNHNNKPVDIRRNFFYNLTVTGVSGPGEETEEKAVESSSGNLTVAMTDWSDGEMKHVVFNSEYFLAVSESTLEISKSEDSHGILVQTNYPSGWKAEVVKGGEWISTLTPGEWTPPAENTEYHKIRTPLSFNVSENNTGEGRDGKIRLSCGENHLSLEVIVTQSTKKEYTLLIEIDDQNNVGSYIEFDKTITFTSGYHDYYEDHPITPRTLRVKWTPVDEELVVDYNRYFDWGTGTDIQNSYQGGIAEIKVIPKRLEELNDWYPESIGDIQIQVGNESSTKQNVLIKRRHHEVYIEKADSYNLDGGTHSFRLYSNTEWGILDETPEGELLTAYFEHIDKYSGNYNLEHKEGEEINFKLIEGSESLSKDLTVLIRFDDAGERIVKPYTIHLYHDNSSDNVRLGEEANCYVLQAGGRGVSIPVSQANRSPLNVSNGNDIKANQSLAVKFIWVDNPNGYGNSNSTVRNAYIDDSDPDASKARLIVEPGSTPGNAVIAVVNPNNNSIHWSWHIWVVDDGFDPYKDNEDDWYWMRYYQFLDRNLGALTDEPTSPKSWGLYYQWGRKDPFPSANPSNTSEVSAMYDENGGEITWEPILGDWSNMSNTNFFGRSIQNPEKFIYSPSVETWYSSDWSSTATINFWSDIKNNNLSTAEKGIYDPCPEGWKTVPAGDNLQAEWNYLPQAVTYYSSGNYSEIKGVIVSGKEANLGKWPHTGYLYGKNNAGEIKDFDRGNYWTGSTNDHAYAFRSHFWGTRNAHPSESFNKISGLPIRCMRRVDKEK